MRRPRPRARLQISRGRTLHRERPSSCSFCFGPCAPPAPARRYERAQKKRRPNGISLFCYAVCARPRSGRTEKANSSASWSLQPIGALSRGKTPRKCLLLPRPRGLNVAGEAQSPHGAHRVGRKGATAARHQCFGALDALVSLDSLDDPGLPRPDESGLVRPGFAPSLKPTSARTP